MKHAARDWPYLPGWGPGLDGVVAVELAAFNAHYDGTLEALDLSDLPGLAPLEDITAERPAPRKRGSRALLAARHTGPTFADWLGPSAPGWAGIPEWSAATQPTWRQYLRSGDMLRTFLQTAERAVDGYRQAYRQGYRQLAEPWEFRQVVEQLKAHSALIRSGTWPSGWATSAADPLHPSTFQAAAGTAEAREFDVLGVARWVAYLETVPEAGQLGVSPELIGRVLTAVPLTREGVDAAGLTARIGEALIDDRHTVSAYDPQSRTALVWPGLSLLAWGSALLHEDTHGASISGPPTRESAWVQQLEDQTETRAAYRQLS